MNRQNFFDHITKLAKKHLFDYLLLLTLGIFFLVLLSLSRGERMAQFMILALFIIFYIFWGITHHLLDKSLRPKIVLEYFLIGITILLLLQIILI
ncbi:hypothetical protein A3C23_01845 [Candidatus Roizmanbacteria bacterium RIFCSPHIGHO2_02_FULL_37_13b]|uniref:Uncharacterized protein n=1 Tax=Candidatus Roizmanbacteria bacterium RIFCSPLOWO2_02_FULL_36_11 TaxID=1802071 RepID=A0A1F7JBP0_9BACT|nr:MAG: hypothetical protein A3C23_01845 [Candidatus Roizmanbacteria bacterium RIFCSPHIGHO2_02_FULL_37_13b]OGK52995.1 MAG: hypothetical protein A3H78_02165 [Candidatus Roizmanbacteria bacterium RIFCSPLOWO2_02_FULL_36_11]